MAIMSIKNGSNNPPGVGITGATQTGITAITQASVERSAGTVVRAKDGQGDVKAVLIGKENITMSVSGYSTNADGASLGDPITVGGRTGKVISASVEATAEDFTRFSAEGRAIKAAGSAPSSPAS